MACGTCHLILNSLSTSFQASGVVGHITYSRRNSSLIALHTLGTNFDIEDLSTINWNDNDWYDSPSNG